MRKRFYLFALLLLPFLGRAQLNTDQVIRMGRNALYYDDYVLSIQLFNKVIDAKPFLYEPYYFRGLAKFYLEDYSGAVSDCSFAIDRNPFIQDFYRLRGLCRIKIGEYTDAVKDYTQSLILEPNDQIAWYNRTLCRIQLKDYKQAFLDLDTMTNKWKEYAKAYEIKAQLLLETKDTLCADSVMSEVLSIQPNNGPIWGMKGLVALRQGFYIKADTLLTKAIKYQPKEATYYLNRALANYYLRRLRNAMEDYDSALSLDPDNFWGHYNRGLLRAQVGEDNKAIEDFNFVIKREPENMLAVFNRALLYEQVGNYKGAISDFSHVIRRHPRFWSGIAYRARCYRKIGNLSAALRDERRLTIAQLNLLSGTTKSRSVHPKTRKRNSQNMEDYKSLVIDDSEDSLSYRKYESEIRGQVQYKKNSEDPMPMIGFVLQEIQTSSHINTSYYLPLLEEWSQKNLSSKALHFNLSSQSSINENAANYDALFKELDIQEKQKDASKEAIDNQNIGILYFIVKNYATAIPYLNKAIQNKGPYVALALWSRAVSRMNVLLHEKGVNKKEDRPNAVSPSTSKFENVASLEDLEQALLLLPRNAYLIYNKGNVYFQMKRYEDALNAYTLALKYDSRLAEAYYNRGLVYLLLKKQTEGLSDLSKAGELGLYSAYSLIKKNSKRQ